MRYGSLVVLLLCAIPAFAGGPLTPRPLDGIAADTLARASERSALIRTLVHELESSNVIVHIESSWTLPSGICGTTRFVAASKAYRYVRISFSVWLSPNDRLAILGHELHHAVEIARSPAADVRALRRLFEASGRRVQLTSDLYETEAAVLFEKEVRRELRTATATVLGTTGR